MSAIPATYGWWVSAIPTIPSSAIPSSAIPTVGVRDPESAIPSPRSRVRDPAIRNPAPRFRRQCASQGSERHGLMIATPVRSKSATLRVTTVMPCTRAVAAIRASRSAHGLGT